MRVTIVLLQVLIPANLIELLLQTHFTSCPSSYSHSHFSEDNVRAMDTSWYKRAVDQHSVEPDSFVYSVPFGSGYAIKSNATLVTASHAIFVEHRGHKAPAGVVGLQFQHDSLAKHFINITSAVSNYFMIG